MGVHIAGARRTIHPLGDENVRLDDENDALDDENDALDDENVRSWTTRTTRSAVIWLWLRL